MYYYSKLKGFNIYFITMFFLRFHLCNNLFYPDLNNFSARAAAQG